MPVMKVTVDSAMRARDVSRPQPEDMAAAAAADAGPGSASPGPAARRGGPRGGAARPDLPGSGRIARPAGRPAPGGATASQPVQAPAGTPAAAVLPRAVTPVNASDAGDQSAAPGKSRRQAAGFRAVPTAGSRRRGRGRSRR